MKSTFGGKFELLIFSIAKLNFGPKKGFRAKYAAKPSDYATGLQNIYNTLVSISENVGEWFSGRMSAVGRSLSIPSYTEVLIMFSCITPLLAEGPGFDPPFLHQYTSVYFWFF